MPCITEIHTLFYSSGKKTLPENIFELLDPIALAH
jgi:LAGLIDADG DNA endonuclease family